MNYVQNHHLDCPIFVHSPSYHKFSQSRNAMNLSNQNTMYCSTRSRNQNVLSGSYSTFSSILNKRSNIRESSINEQLNILDMRLGCSLLNHKFNQLREMLPNSDKKKHKQPQLKNYNNTNVIERNEFSIINQPIIRSRNESINLSQIADDIIDSIHFNMSQEEKEKENTNEDIKKVNELKIEKKYPEDNEIEDIEEKMQPKRRTLIVKSRRSQKGIERELFNEQEDNDMNKVEDNDINEVEDNNMHGVEDNNINEVKDKKIEEKKEEPVKINNTVDKEIICQSNNEVQKYVLVNENKEEKEINNLKLIKNDNNILSTKQDTNELKIEKKDNNNINNSNQEHIEIINGPIHTEGSPNDNKKETQKLQNENHKTLTAEEQDELILQEIIANTKRLEEEDNKKKESQLLQSINSKKDKEEIPFIANISTIKPTREERSIETKKKENRYMTLLSSRSHSQPQSRTTSEKKEIIKEIPKKSSKSTGHSRNMIKKNIQMIKEITKRRSIWKLREARKPHKVVEKENCKKFINNPQQFFTEELCELVLKSYDLPVKGDNDTIPQFRYRDNKKSKTSQSNESQFKSILEKIEIKPIEEVDNEYSNSRTDSNVQTK